MAQDRKHEKLVKLSPFIRKVIAFADAERVLMASPILTTGHILLGLLQLNSLTSQILHVLREYGIAVEQMRPLIHAAIRYGSIEQGSAGWSRELTALFHELSMDIHENPNTSQEVLLVTQLANWPNSISGQILRSFGVRVKNVQ